MSPNSWPEGGHAAPREGRVTAEAIFSPGPRPIAPTNRRALPIEGFTLTIRCRHVAIVPDGLNRGVKSRYLRARELVPRHGLRQLSGVLTIIGMSLLAALSTSLVSFSTATATTINWRASAVPYSISDQADPVYNAVACVSRARCVVGGFDNNQGGALLSLTADGGRNWTPVANLPASISSEIDGLSCSGQDCLAIDSTDDSMARSVDGGEHWQSVALPARWTSTKASPIAVACALRECLVGTAADVELTANGGKSWSDLALPTSAELAYLACSSTGTCHAIAGSGPDGTEDQTLLTLEGRSWGDPHPLPFTVGAGLSCPSSLDCSAVGDELYTTVNGGATWSTSALPEVRQPNFTDVSCIASTSCAVLGFDGFSPVVWFGGFGAASATKAATSLSRSLQSPTGWHSFGVLHEQASAMSCMNGSECIVAALCKCGSQILKSNSTGSEWHPIGETSANINELSCTFAGFCLAIVNNTSSIEGSSDGGATWRGIALPSSWVVQGIEPQAVSCYTGACFMAGDNQASSLYPVAAFAKSTNEGATWSIESVPLRASQAVGLGCAPGDACLFEYGSGQNVTPASATTTNGGETWTVGPGPPPNWGQITAASCQTSKTCYVLGNFILKSTDGGKTWVAMTPPRGGNNETIFSVSCTVGSCVVMGETGSQVNLWKYR